MGIENEAVPEDGEGEDDKIDQELTPAGLEALGAVYRVVNNEDGIVVDDGPLEGDDVLLQEMFDPNYTGPLTDEHTMAWERSDAYKESIRKQEEASAAYDQAMGVMGQPGVPANEVGLQEARDLIRADEETARLLKKMSGKEGLS